MQFISALFTWQNLIHLIDILVIWFLIYELLLLIRGTRAVQLFRGILIIILVKVVSWYIGLSTVSWGTGTPRTRDVLYPQSNG